MKFTAGQRVRMLVACEGDDANDNEQTYPPGTAGLIDQIDERGAYHVIVGPPNDDSILVVIEAADAVAQMQVLPEAHVTARAVAYSSVVGAGIMLCDAKGACVGQLGIRGVAGGRAEQEAMRDRIVDALNYVEGERRIHHPKRGSDYAVLAGEALFQVSQGDMGLDGPMRLIRDGDPVTVYRNHAGTFVRFPDEIVSPRFEEVQS